MIIILYLTVLGIGIFLGSRSLLRSSSMNWIGWLLNASLFILIFLMGVNIGLDETVLTSFSTIGFQALVLVLFIITFSILGVKLVARFVLPRKGEAE
ncbi:MAG: LysO family transporter [Bacillota bacterium]|nr:LysO family transporter [Bacillota bacterium]